MNMNMNNMMGAIPGMEDTSQMAMDAQMQEKLQARGMQQPTYQANGVDPRFEAVANGVGGDIVARNNAMNYLK